MATKIFSTFSLTIDIEQFLIKTPICTNNFHRQIHTVSKVELSHVSIDTNFTTLSIFQELDFPKLYIQCEFPRRNGANFSLRRNPWVFGNDRHRIPCNRPVLAFRKRLCLVFQSILKLIKKTSKVYIVIFLIVYNKRHFPVFSAVILLVATSQYGKTHINRKYGKSMHILNKLKR